MKVEVYVDFGITDLRFEIDVYKKDYSKDDWENNREACLNSAIKKFIKQNMVVKRNEIDNIEVFD